MRPFLLFLFLFPLLLHAQTPAEFRKEIRKHRKHYKKEFLEDERSPISEKKLLRKLDFYPPDASYRLQARFETTPDSKPFEMATYSGITKPYRQHGWLSFTIDGKVQRLAVYQSLRLRNMPGFKDYLFLPFKDATNGETTYGGGRYIDFRMGDISEDGKLWIDFNKCYNPWCAYSDGYNCPVPPRENHLDIAIPAGERKPQFPKRKSP